MHFYCFTGSPTRVIRRLSQDSLAVHTESTECAPLSTGARRFSTALSTRWSTARPETRWTGPARVLDPPVRDARGLECRQRRLCPGPLVVGLATLVVHHAAVRMSGCR